MAIVIINARSFVAVNSSALMTQKAKITATTLVILSLEELLQNPVEEILVPAAVVLRQ